MALGPHAAREQGRRPNWICEHRVLVQYQGHHGGQGQPGLSVTRRKTTPLLREPTRNEATGGFSGPAGHVHSQRRKTKSTERGVTDRSLERDSGANSRAHAVAPKCDIQLGHPTPPALSQLREREGEGENAGPLFPFVFLGASKYTRHQSRENSVAHGGLFDHVGRAQI